MATRPLRPALRERYDRRQQEVVLAAAQVFAARGYDRTSVQELGEAMGLAAGALYHYFAGKEELLVHICDQLMEPLLEQARGIVDEREAPDEQLRDLVRLWVAHVVTHRDHMLVFQQERHVIEAGDAYRGVRAHRKQFERLVDDVLERVHGAGGLAADPRVARAALLGMVNYTVQWYRPKGGLTATQIADGYVGLLRAR